MRGRPVRDAAVSRGGARGANALLSALFVLMAAGLAGLPSRSGELLPALACVGAAAAVATFVLLGRRRTGILALIGAFGTAPAYKGLAPFGSQVTPTDALFVIGFALLLPEILGNKLRLPLTYIVGISTVVVTGLVASAASVDPVTSLFSMVLWMAVMLGLPTAIVLWGPSAKLVQVLAWSYVGGHILNTAYALVDGPVVAGRYMGRAFHPNFFGEAGVMATALLLYLFYVRAEWRYRVIVLGAGAICAASIYMSGSRAATLVVAVLIMMIPVVERSAVTGFLYALLGGLVVAALPFLIDLSGENSSLARLTGSGSASGSDEAREAGLSQGVDRFMDSIFIGEGLVDLFDIHNNMLEVAVALGVFGLVGYLLVLYTFCRPLFGDGQFRRLCYTGWGSVGFGLTVPSLYDRGIWAPLALSAVAFAVARKDRGDGSLDAGVAPSVSRRPA